MSDSRTALERRITWLETAGASRALQENRIGLEKEALRLSAAGRLAETPHPPGLGAALTHPFMTTDFSEALIELITPPHNGGQAALDFLTDIHRYVYGHLGDELLWAGSMPCDLSDTAEIPLATYGTSNAATMKTAYRRGLGNRYGRAMQLIAGVHCNFSFSDAFWELYAGQGQGQNPSDPIAFRSESQMGMVRHLQRIGWLVPYLFGASPAVGASFVKGQDHDLLPLAPDTLCYPHATSLRMGDIGYQNKQEEGTGMKASYDSLDSYVRSLTWAIQTPCPLYEGIGVKVGDRYEQLNANVLQIENEYYSTVRPKQIADWMEKPTLALRRRGIRYIELRSLDVDLFDPVGVGAEQLLFLETLMLYSLLLESPRINARERREIDENQLLTAHRGREPGLNLVRDRAPIPLRRWASEILDEMAAAAALLDGGADGAHARCLQRQADKVAHPDLTPSARILETLREGREGYCGLAWRLSGEHRQRLTATPLAAEPKERFDRLTDESLARRREIEAADDQSFDDFLSAYFDQ